MRPATVDAEVMGKCKAKVEYFARKNDVLQLLSEGFSRRAIFKSFTKAGYFSMSYQTFCQYVRDHGEVKANTVDSHDSLSLNREMKQQIVNKTSGPQIIESEGDSFKQGIFDSSAIM